MDARGFGHKSSKIKVARTINVRPRSLIFGLATPPQKHAPSMFFAAFESADPLPQKFKIPSKEARDFKFCGPDRTRTCHPLSANEVLYQMSYGPNIYDF